VKTLVFERSRFVHQRTNRHLCIDALLCIRHYVAMQKERGRNAD
jgi:hypothetical protein